MSLRHAILGFLSTTPASGYTLGRRFSDGAGSMWEALPSQIYPELKKLVNLGWIEGETDESDQLKRRVYRVTTTGRAALQTWVESSDAEHPPERDAELVRFLFLDRSDFDVIRHHAIRHRDHYEERLETWCSERDAIAERTHDRSRDRLEKEPAENHGFITGMKWFAFHGLVRRAEMEISWANEVLVWLEDLKGDRLNSPLPIAAQATTKAARRPTTAVTKQRNPKSSVRR
ncbi:MAG: helix-turn-helix transcriptional regulator [Polaromonas sp.]|nr:helix-turn-helix transcriptional regulator [Polaromonas sp.]